MAVGAGTGVRGKSFASAWSIDDIVDHSAEGVDGEGTPPLDFGKKPGSKRESARMLAR